MKRNIHWSIISVLLLTVATEATKLENVRTGTLHSNVTAGTIVLKSKIAAKLNAEKLKVANLLISVLAVMTIEETHQAEDIRCFPPSFRTSRHESLQAYPPYHRTRTMSQDSNANLLIESQFDPPGTPKRWLSSSSNDERSPFSSVWTPDHQDDLRSPWKSAISLPLSPGTGRSSTSFMSIDTPIFEEHIADFSHFARQQQAVPLSPPQVAASFHQHQQMPTRWQQQPQLIAHQNQQLQEIPYAQKVSGMQHQHKQQLQQPQTSAWNKRVQPPPHLTKKQKHQKTPKADYPSSTGADYSEKVPRLKWDNQPGELFHTAWQVKLTQYNLESNQSWQYEIKAMPVPMPVAKTRHKSEPVRRSFTRKKI